MQLVTEAIPSEGTVDGWRQVGSHAAVRHAGARSSRGRHAAVAVLLVAAGAAAVLMTLGSERGQQLAQLKTETDSTGLTAPQIPGIRAETQDIIDSGMWDPKVCVKDARCVCWTCMALYQPVMTGQASSFTTNVCVCPVLICFQFGAILEILCS